MLDKSIPLLSKLQFVLSRGMKYRIHVNCLKENDCYLHFPACINFFNVQVIKKKLTKYIDKINGSSKICNL